MGELSVQCMARLVTQPPVDAQRLQALVGGQHVADHHLRLGGVVAAPIGQLRTEALAIGRAQVQQAQAQALEAVEQQRSAREGHPAKARGGQQLGERHDQQAGIAAAHGSQVADLGDPPARRQAAAVKFGDALLDRRIQVVLEKQRALLATAHAEGGLQLLTAVIEPQQAGHEVADPCAIVFGEALADEVFQLSATACARLLHSQMQRQFGIRADRRQKIVPTSLKRCHEWGLPLGYEAILVRQT
ncbi:hypothetical protein OF001_U140037 [Pseudomonas sp. OF001]|nr:hypothetical protein OF001_U140037 [Pseudomonas sp. OF001]